MKLWKPLAISSLAIGVSAALGAQTKDGAKQQPVTTSAAQSSPEMERLATALSGTWSITLKVEPNERFPKGGGKGEEVWSAGPGGLSVIENYHSTGDEGEIAGLGVFWWDENARRYQVLWCDNSNPAGCVVMTHGASWEGNDMVVTNEWEESGNKFALKEVFSHITPTSFEQILYQGDSGGELRPVVVIHATKKSIRMPREGASSKSNF